MVRAPDDQAKIEELQRTIRGLETELKARPEMAAEPIVVQHQQISARLSELQRAIAWQDCTAKRLQDLKLRVQSEVDRVVKMLQQLKEEFGNLLTFPQWEQLKLRPDPQALPFLDTLDREACQRVVALRTQGLPNNRESSGEGRG